MTAPRLLTVKATAVVAPPLQRAKPVVDELEKLKTQLSQLCLPLIAPMGIAPSLVAAFTLAKSHSTKDLFHEITTQLTTLTNALEKLKNNPTDTAVAALKTIAAQIQKGRENLLLAKARALKTLANPSTKLSKVRELLQKMKIHFHDREFLFHFARILVTADPRFLCTVLKEIPLTNKNDILQLGALLKKPELRAQFAAHYKIPKEEIETARAQHVKTFNEARSRLNGRGGNCQGNTLTQMSRNPPLNPKAFHHSAMFVQAAYRLQLQTGNHATAVLHQAGRAILDEPHNYPQTLARAAKLLGYASTEALIFDDMAKNKSAKLAELVCRIAFRPREHLPALSPAEAAALKSLDKNSCINPCPINDEIPAAILKKLGLKAGKAIASAAPLSHLSANLKALKDKSGKILITLRGKVDNHAIYLSFDPPSFSDINDSDLITLDPKVRTFKTADEMIDALRKHLLFTYQDRYDAFALVRYEEIPALKLTLKAG